MITIDEKNNTITVDNQTYSLATKEGFERLSKIWLRSSWDTKHMYSFTWLGYPLIQLPEDALRMQELVFTLKPDVIIETGVNYGGSLLFYATLCAVLGKGKVVGVEIDIRQSVRKMAQEHPLANRIELIKGDSIAPKTVDLVKEQIKPDDRVLVLLDAKHTKAHVLEELRLYAPLVSVGSYIVAMDGIMGDLHHAKRQKAEWIWNNAQAAAQEFAAACDSFVIEEPPFLFNASRLSKWVTNCPGGFLKRVK